MTTINQVAQQVVKDSIDWEYIAGTNLKEVYSTEYGHNGLTPKSCADYLAGLPSVCTVPFMNHDILQLLEQNGITRRTESAQSRLIDEYWKAVGHQFYRLVR